MPKAWIIARINSQLIEVFQTAGWEVVPSALPDFTPVDLSSVRDPDVMIYDVEGEALSEAFRQTCELKIAPLLAIVPNWDLARQAIEAGADDAMLAPADTAETVFRAHRLVRAAKIVRVGELAIDLIAQSVKRKNQLIRLSPLEFRLLACLAQHVGQAVTYDAILDEVWGCDPESGGTPRLVKNCVSRLRRKIEPEPGQPQYVIAIKRVGYRLQNQIQWEDAIFSS